MAPLGLPQTQDLKLTIKALRKFLGPANIHQELVYPQLAIISCQNTRVLGLQYWLAQGDLQLLNPVIMGQALEVISYLQILGILAIGIVQKENAKVR